ncbi:MAG: GspE/PulE family protein [Pseudomonadota bacterium]
MAFAEANMATDTSGFPKHLMERHAISAEQIDRIKEVSQSTGQPIRVVLDRLGIFSQAEWAKAASEELGMKLVEEGDFPSPLPTDERLSPDYMRRNGVAPILIEKTKSVLAVADPYNDEVKRALRMLFGSRLELCVATDRTIEAVFSRTPDTDLNDTSPNVTGDLDAERLRDLANNAPTIKYLEGLFARAVELGATDIHLEVLENQPRVRLRIDGILESAPAPEKSHYEGVVSRIKILGEMDISERRLPQDGRIRYRMAGRAIDIRVASAPSIHGEALVLRLLDNSQKLSRLDSLALPRDVEDRLRTALTAPNGLILMTGPTGSGKTTTLHAALGAINTAGRKIITIENPVEVRTEGLVQLEVNPDLGWGFANALRSVLRHDPDVIMVGEIRDSETAELAIRAALTGHLVVSSLHTNKSSEAIVRLRDMGVPDYLLYSVVRMVGAQRLIRRLCPHCAADDLLVPKSQNALIYQRLAKNLPGSAPLQDWTLKKAVGCDHCNRTGYSGRVALFEALNGDEARKIAVGEGVTQETMAQQGLKMVSRGETTLSEVVRVFGVQEFQ